ncbi:MAG: carbamate kinase [Planctomycetota bacterium]
MKKVREGSAALVAFGGNVFTGEKEAGSIEEQRANARAMCRRLMLLRDRGYELVVTHGNGPQVGNLLVQNEMAREVIPDFPLDVLVAETEGSLGYLVQQELLDLLRGRPGKNVVTMITQVVVDPNDPAFKNPTKPVGPFYGAKEAESLRRRFPHWRMIEDAGRGWRRIVPSPMPKRVVQSHMIRSLAYAGNVVVALGGGGVPIAEREDGRTEGVEAVIDKDLSSALLAADVKADLFVILTGVDHVSLNFGKKNEEKIAFASYGDVKAWLADGHFPPGSMGPKMAAALLYLENGGREVVITSPAKLEKAVDGQAGTHIVWK